MLTRRECSRSGTSRKKCNAETSSTWRRGGSAHVAENAWWYTRRMIVLGRQDWLPWARIVLVALALSSSLSHPAPRRKRL